MAKREEDIEVEDYRGWKIMLDTSWSFRADRPDGNTSADRMYGDALRTIKTRIDERMADEEKAQRITWETFEAMDDSGTDVVISGIRKNDGRLMAKPYKEASYFYPRSEYLRQLIKETNELQQELSKRTKILWKCRIDGKGTYGGRTTYTELTTGYERTLRDFKSANDRLVEVTREKEIKAA